MFIGILSTTLLQIFCEIVLNSKVIAKSYCQKYRRSRRQFLEELLSVNGIRLDLPYIL